MGVCLSVLEPRLRRVPSGPGAFRRPKWSSQVAASGEEPSVEKAEKGKGQQDDLSALKNRLVDSGALQQCLQATVQGQKGLNQDAIISWESFASMEACTFCGVFDGHGLDGAAIASSVRDSVAKNFEAALLAELNWLSRLEIDAEGASLRDAVKNAYLKCISTTEKLIHALPQLDTYCSGTTAVTAFKKGNELFLANVGDSRAVLGSRVKGCMVAEQLTVDLKPDLPRENKRILRHRGRVFAMAAEPDVARVWLPNEDVPGLAMSRSLGDAMVKRCGVSAEPEISHRAISGGDEFVVLASDGVWDVLSNSEAVQMVAAAADGTAATQLVNAAASRWKKRMPNSRQDDISAVIMYLQRDPVLDLVSNPILESGLDGGDALETVATMRNYFQSKRTYVQIAKISSDLVFNDEGQRLWV